MDGPKGLIYQTLESRDELLDCPHTVAGGWVYEPTGKQCRTGLAEDAVTERPEPSGISKLI